MADPARKDKALIRKVLAASAQLRDEADGLRFADPVAWVYNPLRYAWPLHEQYVRTWGASPRRVLMLGMNPGPWGMAQTGVPFGEIAMVCDWMGIESGVETPPVEHPKRRIEGFDCSRSEVSGRRLWGWARDTFGEATSFFDRFFVANYCPLAFLEESGRNLTPDKLPAAERAPLFEACDRALRGTVEALRPEWVVGIGTFAEARARSALGGVDVRVGRGLHPSPASPAANRGWAPQWERDLSALGIEIH